METEQELETIEFIDEITGERVFGARPVTETLVDESEILIATTGEVTGEEIEIADRTAEEQASVKLPEETIETLNKSGYSNEDIQKYVNMGIDVSRVPVLNLLKLTLQEGPRGGVAAVKLLAKIDKLLVGAKHGHLTMDFEGIPYKFGICLSLLDRGFTPQIDIPGAYENDVLEQFKSLKLTAVAYWDSFRINNPRLIKKIDQFRKDVDFSTVTNDPLAPMTMYFDPGCSKRVVVCPYYLNGQGEILSKPPIACPVTTGKKTHGRRRKR